MLYLGNVNYEKGRITQSEQAAATRVQGTVICLHFKRQLASLQPLPQVPAAPACPRLHLPSLPATRLTLCGVHSSHCLRSGLGVCTRSTYLCSCPQLQEQPGLLSGTSKVTRNKQQLKLGLVVAYLHADLHLFKSELVGLGQAKQQAA